ncbi:MAG: hypothetical protein AB8B66_05100, partial [Rickettsiaceae bacterium]
MSKLILYLFFLVIFNCSYSLAESNSNEPKLPEIMNVSNDKTDTGELGIWHKIKSFFNFNTKERAANTVTTYEAGKDIPKLPKQDENQIVAEQDINTKSTAINPAASTEIQVPQLPTNAKKPDNNPVPPTASPTIPLPPSVQNKPATPTAINPAASTKIQVPQLPTTTKKPDNKPVPPTASPTIPLPPSVQDKPATPTANNPAAPTEIQVPQLPTNAKKPDNKPVPPTASPTIPLLPSVQ